jgi:hypothetical protein
VAECEECGEVFLNKGERLILVTIGLNETGCFVPFVCALGPHNDEICKVIL